MKIYKFSGIDYDNSHREFGQSVIVTLDGVNYECDEDPDDGYRSYAGAWFKTEREPRYKFAPIEICIKNVKSYNFTGIHFIDIQNGETFLAVGTDYSEDYYPCAIFDYHPEKLSINKNK